MKRSSKEIFDFMKIFILGTPPIRKDDDFQYAAEILITKSELEDKNKLVFTLQQQVDETKTESEYQLRLKDNKYAEEARILKKKFNADISDLKQVSTLGYRIVV